MKFNVKKQLETDLGWVLLTSIAEQPTDSPVFTQDQDGNLDVRLTINGKEVDFERTITRLLESFKHEVGKEAKALIRERCNSLYDKLASVEHAVDKVLRDHLAEDYLES